MAVKIKGIDVSKYQGKIDWNKVKGDGVQFVMIRAGWSHYDGGLDVDECFHANIKGATAAGIAVGVYVYSYDRSAAAAVISAKKVVELLKPYKLTYPVVYDIEYEEWNKTTGKGKLNTDMTIAFLEEISRAGYRPMVYASTDFYRNYLDDSKLAKYDHWVAQYGTACTYSGKHTIWQYSSTGKAAGISGNVDMNWCYIEYDKSVPSHRVRVGNFKRKADADNARQAIVNLSFWADGCTVEPSETVRNEWQVNVQPFKNADTAKAAVEKIKRAYGWYCEVKGIRRAE